MPVIEDIRANGSISPQKIADALNARGITAARGGVDMCNVPRAGAPVDAQFFPKTRDVRLTMLRSGNHPKMVHEYYVLLSYLQPKDNKTSAGSKANGVN